MSDIPDPDALFRALAETWPAAAEHRAGAWLLREGAGAGSRVSSARPLGPVGSSDLPLLQDAAARLGQSPLVQVRAGQDALDAMLAAAGYALRDETLIMAAPVGALPPASRMTAFALWPPLGIQRDIWAESGIGAARQAVMERVTGPKAALLGRLSDRAAGVGFVAVSEGIAFVSAVAVLPAFRRQGCARNMMGAAAHWAQAAGATHLALAVTRANEEAGALYASLGMEVVGKYHYRAK
ncbi:MAG TPA: GNAT family N-acetyltransferase [Paracoccaceae bacterium]|nr:GNAT family N-acetyltransferase [Paracoccaceae bacterium]HMO71243.1 GNAT family N-acetyltransferase [Paracoccaceae bacterium]